MSLEYDRQLRDLCAEIDAAQDDVVLAIRSSGDTPLERIHRRIDTAKTRRHVAEEALLAFLRDRTAA